MSLTPRQLNRATLGRQLLLARERLDVADAVHRIVAIQGQEPPSIYVALWDRLVDFDPADLDRAFADGSVVKASTLRMTIHVQDPRDHLAFHEVMTQVPRGSPLDDPRIENAGVSLDEADLVLRELLAFAAQPRTGVEIEAWLDDRLAPRPGKPLMWALYTYAPLRHATSGGPWSFNHPRRYLAAPDDGEPLRSGDPEDSMRHLARRYLEGFGPASMPDLAQFARVTRSRARAALDWLVEAGEAVMVDGPNGSDLYDVPGGLLPPEDTPAPPRLLPMWEETLLAYDDRSRVIAARDPQAGHPPERRHAAHAPGRWVRGGRLAPDRCDGIEATAFHPLDDDAWDGLETEARGMRAFLADREPRIFHGRFAHWWAKLPEAEVRLLGV